MEENERFYLERKLKLNRAMTIESDFLSPPGLA